ncbi:MAG: MFS transporter [Burkholderiales bacterium]|nr:MFS transporter [Burkholderiales bacterium]
MKPIHLVLALALLNFSTVAGGRVLLTLYALQFGALPFAIGVLAATFSAFPMLLAWLAGRLTDRFGARWLLIFGAAGSGCGMLIPYLFPRLPALYFSAALLGLSFTFYTVSLQNLVGALGKSKEHARNYSNFAMVAAFANFLGPMVSGFSIDHIGFGLACLNFVLLSLIAVLMLVFRGGLLPGDKSDTGPAGSIKEMLADRNVRRVLVTSSMVQLGIDLFQFYLPIYGHDIGLSASAIGVVLAMFAAASFIVRAVIPHMVARMNEEVILAGAFYIAAASYFLIPFCGNTALLSLAALLLGLGMGCGPPITMMMTYSQSPADRSGEALGLRFTANHFVRVIGPLAFGLVGSAFGLFPVFWVNAVLMGCGGYIFRRGARARNKS